MQGVGICIVSSILHGSYNRFTPWFGIEVYSVPFVGWKLSYGCMKLFMVLLTGSYQNILAHIYNTHSWYTHMYLQPLGATTVLKLSCNIHHISCTPWTPYAHIHLAGEEKYVARNIAKPWRLLHRSRISTFVIANPRTKTWRGSRNYEQYVWEIRVCLTLILKLSHFQKQIMSQFFQTFILNFPSKIQDGVWNTSGLAHFYQPQSVLTWWFSGS